MRKKAIVVEKARAGRLRSGARPLPVFPAVPPSGLEHSDWPSEQQWRRFWAQQQQLLAEHGLLSPDEIDELSE